MGGSANCPVRSSGVTSCLTVALEKWLNFLSLGFLTYKSRMIIAMATHGSIAIMATHRSREISEAPGTQQRLHKQWLLSGRGCGPISPSQHFCSPASNTKCSWRFMSLYTPSDSKPPGPLSIILPGPWLDGAQLY